MQHLRLTVQVNSVIIKFDSVLVAHGSYSLPAAPVPPERLKVVTLHQCLVRISINRRLPSHTPINVPFYAAKNAEESLSEVPLRVQVVLRLFCPVFPALNKVPNHTDIQIQLAGSTILHHVHTPDNNITNW